MVRTKKESLVKIITLLILQVVVQGSQIDVVSKSIGILAFGEADKVVVAICQMHDKLHPCCERDPNLRQHLSDLKWRNS